MNDLLTGLYLFAGWQPYTWLAVLVAASLLDALTTVYALKQPNMREANPVMRRAMDRLGIVPALLVVKAVPLALMFYGLQEYILYVPALVAVYVAATLWNLYAIHRSRP